MKTDPPSVPYATGAFVPRGLSTIDTAFISQLFEISEFVWKLLLGHATTAQRLEVKDHRNPDLWNNQDRHNSFERG